MFSIIYDTIESILDNKKCYVAQRGLCDNESELFKNIEDFLLSKYQLEKLPSQLIILDDQINGFKIIEKFDIRAMIRSKKSVAKGDPIKKDDILDCQELNFYLNDNEKIKIEINSQIFWVFCTDTSKCIYYDFTKNASISIFEKQSATAWIQASYLNILLSINNYSNSVLLKKGWFPFVGILESKYIELEALIDKNNESDITVWMDKHFSFNQIENIYDRLQSKKIFYDKKEQIKEGFECYREGKYIAAICTLTPLIEGFCHDYNCAKPNNKLKENHSKLPNSLCNLVNNNFTQSILLLPDLFKEYLEKFVFKSGTNYEKANRHTVTHGKALSKAYTRERALQLILTLDQLYFYLSIHND